ncbi:Uncharacterised protein [Aeromonas hydrophila]|nr:Uncharacterised protein [Aeromonas hydrophila]
MSHNLCALAKELQERVEVEKAVAYAVWKERNGRHGRMFCICSR